MFSELFLFLLSCLLSLTLIESQYCSKVSDESITKNGKTVSSNEPVLRVVGLGDFHGDMKSAVKAMKIAGLVDKELNWAGGKTVFVQTGDIVDRGPDTIALYDLMQKLTEQAPKVGGKVIALLGNHEVMNMMGDLRYVTREDIRSFGGYKARQNEWSPEGKLGKYLRSLDMATDVNGTVFVHGGIDLNWAEKGIDYINSQTKKGLKGDLPVEQVYGQFPVLLSDNNPVWYRGYAEDPENKACKNLYKALKMLKAERMVMGHTPQFDGEILARCKKDNHHRLYIIDVAMSSAYNSAGCAALEILHYDDGSVTVKGLYKNKEIKY